MYVVIIIFEVEITELQGSIFFINKNFMKSE